MPCRLKGPSSQDPNATTKNCINGRVLEEEAQPGVGVFVSQSCAEEGELGKEPGLVSIFAAVINT